LIKTKELIIDDILDTTFCIILFSCNLDPITGKHDPGAQNPSVCLFVAPGLYGQPVFGPDDR